MTRKCINADGAVAVGPYSHAVEAGEFLFLSGQTPIDPQTQKISEGNIVEKKKKSIDKLVKEMQE
ncbi:RidA family protein [Priestia megaterium]|uniref:RidA family protein n=1 Tax=Priestia megaterium TaxID=1404 RepID=UPI002E20AA31|nr:Rid family hydrolase [Priestia megaterium]